MFPVQHIVRKQSGQGSSTSLFIKGIIIYAYGKYSSHCTIDDTYYVIDPYDYHGITHFQIVICRVDETEVRIRIPKQRGCSAILVSWADGRQDRLFFRY